MGILLYTMCYHRHPFQGKHGGDILEARIPQHDRGAYPRVEGFIGKGFRPIWLVEDLTVTRHCRPNPPEEPKS